MESPFVNTDIAVPNMQFDELRDFVESTDVGAYFDFLHCVPEEDRNREGMLNYLREHEPALYACAEAVTEAFQNAFFLAGCQQKALVSSYQLFKVAKRSFDGTSTSLEQEIEKQVQEEKPAQKKKRARAEKKNPEQEKVEQKQDMEVVKKARKVISNAGPKFYAQERFSASFPFHQFLHVAKRGKKKLDLKVLPESQGWATIYHCSGPWQAEELVADLKSQGCKCITIKRARGGTDQEVMSYKVLSSR